MIYTVLWLRKGSMVYHIAVIYRHWMSVYYKYLFISDFCTKGKASIIIWSHQEHFFCVGSVYNTKCFVLKNNNSHLTSILQFWNEQIFSCIQADWQRISRIALSSQTADRAEAPAIYIAGEVSWSPAFHRPRTLLRSRTVILFACVQMHGHRVWILWLPVFTRPQAKRCLYAAIQLSRCGGSSDLPLHYLWCFRGDFSPPFRIFLIFEQSGGKRV